jgi:hypothetical protein
MEKDITYQQLEEKTETVTICDYCGKEISGEVQYLCANPQVLETPTVSRQSRVLITPLTDYGKHVMDSQIQMETDSDFHLHEKCIKEAFEI